MSTTKTFTTTLCWLLLFSASPLLHRGAQEKDCQIEETSYLGWRSYKLSNGMLTLHIVPAIGGRIIQLQLGEHPYFWINKAIAGQVFSPEQNGGPQGGWKNYGGSKVWPAPQGWQTEQQWPGPPDPVLDGGRYSGQPHTQSNRHVAVTLTSPPDKQTGLQFSRTIHVEKNSTQIQIDHKMKNIGRHRVRWATWEVTQHDTADPENPSEFNSNFWAYCPMNPRSLHPKGYWPMFGQVNHPSYQPHASTGTLRIHYTHRVGKVGLDSSAGWLATVNGRSNHCFVTTFRFLPGATYPDNASVEFWLNGAGEFLVNGIPVGYSSDSQETPYFMESEVLSPLVELDPGEEYPYQVKWFVTRCPQPILDVTQVGAVSRKFSAITVGNEVRLEGIFGVFHSSRAEAHFRSADGKIIKISDLGPVSPLQVFRLSTQLSLPTETYRVSLLLVNRDGQRLGVLGNTVVQLPK